MIRGFCWRFGDNVNTDLIFPQRYSYIIDPEELAKHAMEGIDPGFFEKVRPGDIIVAGDNFGSGSSMEHATIALKNIGVGAVVAASFARIFYRNAISLGFPVVECIKLPPETSIRSITDRSLSFSAATSFFKLSIFVLCSPYS